MDRQSTPTRSELKCMLSDENAEPKALPLSLLEEITNGFSEEQEIGRGGFAVVYKGILDNGAAIAVKRLSHTYMYEKQFHREIECLIKVKHKNVVRFIGYCVDSQGIAGSYNGKFVMADVQQRLLCFEYLPHGTLDKYITDASHGLDWRTRYKIINGICDGLHYLHQNLIFHMDLKPPNILLDGNMLPKIADFGLSRCFEEKQSRVITSKIYGTMGYLAPESGSREITHLFDLYSLGVIIIEILTGNKGYEDVENVLESWSNRLEESHKDIQLEQIRVCTMIGIECREFNPAKRPVSMHHIIARLHETGNTEGSIVVTKSSALQVVESWRNRLAESQGDIQLQQVRVSSETEIECTDSNPAKRPDSIQHIIDRLDERGSMEGYNEAGVISSQQLFEQAENSSNELHQDTPKDQEETSSQNFTFSWPTNLFLDQTPRAQMSQVVLPALTKIGSILGDESTMVIIADLTKKATKLMKLPGQVEQIGKQLSMLGIIIGKIGIVHLTDGIIKSWIQEVRKLACRVEDVMDKCSYHVAKLKEGGFLKKISMKQTHYVKVFNEIMDEVSEVHKEIQQVIQRKDQWQQPCKEDSLPIFIQNEDLVGIDKNRMQLTEWLYSKELENNAITVSGVGGLGKSTLVSNVYEREKINFPAHAWIVVSQVYTVDALLKKLLWKIGYTEQPLSAGIDKMDVHDLKKEIQQRLQNRKYLIVLDDVWEQEAYFQINDAFPNIQGSRIVITTRKDHVAGISSPTHHLELLPLGNPDAFDLFCTRAFYNMKGHMCPKDLETIATKIVDRCHGLPLAIVTISSMLSFRQQLDTWQQTYNQLLELSTDDPVRDILNVSYHSLSGDLRNCLVYCTLFPGDYPVSGDTLVRLWVAEDFVPSKGNNTPEVVAEGILRELIHRKMLEVVASDELGRVNTCKMHDIVRELATSFAEEEGFALANDYGTMIQIDRDVRRLSLCGWKDNTAVKLKLPRLRTVVSLSSSTAMLPLVLPEASYLTVLELQDSEITEVPTSIGSLFNLHYIGLRRTKVKSLPDSIENLSNLQTLDIKQTKIVKLPRGIVKIRKLRHLLADRYDDEKQTEFRYFVGMRAPKDLSNLEELQTLETLQSSNDLAAQLKKLMQLRSLWIDNISAAECANLFATLSTMPLLSSLLLSARDENEALCFEALKPRSTDLHRLIIRGQWAMGTLNCPIFLSHGKNLKYLALSWCHLGEDPLGMLAPHMPNLTYLKLNNMRSANSLVLSAGSFPNLITLVLKHMHDVSEIKISNGALPCIEGLYVVSLLNLHKVPQGIESLPSLRKLWLLGLHKDFRSQWLNSGMHQKILHVPEVRV